MLNERAGHVDIVVGEVMETQLKEQKHPILLLNSSAKNCNTVDYWRANTSAYFQQFHVEFTITQNITVQTVPSYTQTHFRRLGGLTSLANQRPYISLTVMHFIVSALEHSPNFVSSAVRRRVGEGK